MAKKADPKKKVREQKIYNVAGFRSTADGRGCWGNEKGEGEGGKPCHGRHFFGGRVVRVALLWFCCGIKYIITVS